MGNFPPKTMRGKYAHPLIGAEFDLMKSQWAPVNKCWKQKNVQVQSSLFTFFEGQEQNRKGGEEKVYL